MKKAMIVDDSKIVRKVMRRMLEGLGYAVAEAEDGQAGLAAFLADPAPLILLDWHMPVMDGIGFLKALRAEPGGDAPVVIFVTTETEIAHIQMAIEAGADEYVMKPFDEEILKSKLEQLGLLP